MPPKNPKAHALFRTAKAVCFDVDSTVIQEEGIDVLAAFAGVGEQVAQLTLNAMGGTVPFEIALENRLDLIRPSRAMVADCMKKHPPRLTPGCAELLRRLHARGVHVYLISGGFHQMIDPIAKLIGIPPDRVIANLLQFNADGSFHDFDHTQPTSASGGKAKALQQLKTRFGYSPLVMVGDGVTDMEARPPADCFIGFGGVVVRDKVQAGADWFVTGFAELDAVL